MRTIKTIKNSKTSRKNVENQQQRSKLKKNEEYRSSIAHKKSSNSSSSDLKRINQFRYHPIPLLIGGTAVAYCAGYFTYLTVTFYKPHDGTIPVDASMQENVSSRYDSIASSFDDTVDSNEYWLGITSLRKRLVSQAHGNVLEVSIGTGRNLAFYDWSNKPYNSAKSETTHQLKMGKVRSLTAIDVSSQMLDIARDKLEKMIPGMKDVRWILGDASEAGTIPEPPQASTRYSESYEAKYDTIIQTMGLCSVKNPVALLQKLGEWIKEEDGRILLLEHGRGHWKWLNTMLDKSAKDHAQTFGCWWNRDLPKIVAESGLDVVQMNTPKWWHGGTTWWIELKKPKKPATNLGFAIKSEPSSRWL